AKIARLTKRFGAAKEDLKKRQENPPNPPVSPGKSAVDVNSNNNVPYRNASTVRQMLESKRNVSESAPPSFQTPVNTVSSTNLVTPPTVVSSQPKLQTPVTSGSLTATSVLPAPNTATIDQLKQELSKKESELLALQTKLETLSNQNSDCKQHIEVLKESLTAKEQRAAILQTE
ncbi:hypothetical protein MC885_021436, partial [Smutsia gigantea]